MAHLMELRRHAGHYVQAAADSFRLTVRQAALRTVLGCLGAVVGVAVLVTSTVMLLDGIAGGIAAALGGRVWAGQLITGAVVLSGIALACWWLIGRMTESSRRRTIEKYERQHHQRATGHSTDEPGRHEQPV
jgi:hypothetical protein